MNKNKPEKKCHGQCHVNKQIKQVEEQDKTPVNPLKEKVELQLFKQDQKEFNFNKHLVSDNHFYAYQAIISDRHIPPVDHPPLI
ncbi:MAG: hypothetical protein IPM77_17675 [Crocinitomicaceae bacterium]|nr:hypothetical protein [Crocinitomicaceae bacterium]